MPKLLMHLAASKIIVDANDNTLSIVSIIQEIHIARKPGADLTNAVTPLDWSILTVWNREPDDGQSVFEQRIELILPNGEAVAQGEVQFQMSERTHRITVRMQGVPASQAGECRVHLSLRCRETGDEVCPPVDYPILVKYVDADADDQESLHNSPPTD